MKRTNFVIRMENFPLRDSPVRSSVVTAELGEEASLWVLELVPVFHQAPEVSGFRWVSASLWRRDHMCCSLEVCLTLTVFCPSLVLQGRTVTTSHIVPKLQDTQQERLGFHLQSFLTEQDLQWGSSSNTLRIECELTVRLPPGSSLCQFSERKTSLPELSHLTSWFPERQYSLSDLDGEIQHCQIRRLEDKHLVFGPVEEVHYLARRPRLTVWDRISRGWDIILQGIEAGHIKNPYMLLPVHV